LRKVGEEGGVKFGEELRASPPRRVREINIRSTTPGVAKNLFSFGTLAPRAQSLRTPQSPSGHKFKEHGMQSGVKKEGLGYEAGKLNEFISNELVHSVKDMQVDGSSPNRSCSVQSGGAKERVSFGNDMSLSEESDNSANMQQHMQEMKTVVGRFHTKKFGSKTSAGAERKSALKVQTGGATKKQKTPVKSNVKAALEYLMQGEGDEKLNMTTMEMELPDRVAPLRSKPRNLTGTPDEARQEK
jgi:hypothetical protein